MNNNLNRLKLRVFNSELAKVFDVKYFDIENGIYFVETEYPSNIKINNQDTFELILSRFALKENDVIIQCTAERDKTGTLVYEGDLLKVKLNDSNNTAIGICEYICPRFVFRDNDGGKVFDFYKIHDIEIIGNFNLIKKYE